MKKLLYINLDFSKYQNKAKAQIKSFKKFNIETEIATIDVKNNDYLFRIYEYKNKEFNIKLEKKLTDYFEIKQGDNSLKTLFKRFINTKKMYNLFKKEVINYYDDYDYCYIRRIGFFIIFFKSMLKTISKKSKIIYEIPTYPLDKYDSFFVNMAQKIEMVIFNLCLKKYITIIPIMMQNDVILDKKMIPMFNAVDYEKFKDINVAKPEFKDTLNILILAHILPWHGYDRLIESIKNYDGKYKINVDIYSDFNAETLKLKSLVEKYDLKNINFNGQKPLDEILNDIDKYNIAIGSLGYHRRNGKYDTSIKNKEYTAMGLPFVCSAKDLAFNDTFKYMYLVSANDEIFDINEIVDWYKEIYKEDYKKHMRSYAKQELSFEKCYDEVFKRLDDEK